MTKKYLFTGEESYLLHKELKKRKDGFITKNGPDTVVSLSLAQNESKEIIQVLCSNGLFSDNKLIIVHGMPGETTSPGGTTDLEEQIIRYRKNLNPDYFYIFVSPKPDKRKKAFKFFSENCETKIFGKMEKRTLYRFINDEFSAYLSPEKKGTLINEEFADIIIDSVGTDGRNLMHECQKLSISINRGDILSKELIKKIVTPLAEANSFWIMENLIKESPSVYTTIDTLRDQGQERPSIQGSLLRGLKGIIAFGLTTRYEGDTKSLGLPPFTLSKYKEKKEQILGQLSGYQSLYHDLIDLDYQIKIGRQSKEGYSLYMKEKIHKHFGI